VPSYSDDHITTAWEDIHVKFLNLNISSVSRFLTLHNVRKSFLDITPQDVQDCLRTSVADAFSFARGAISTFENDIEESSGKRGALIVTGATASTRGNIVTSAFAATRALSEPGERI
jgi:hypothetical protein